MSSPAAGKSGFLNRFQSWVRETYEGYALPLTMQAHFFVKQAGWMIVTVGMITMLPLLIEVRREAAVEQLEQLQINQMLAEGRTPQELASSGLTAAVAPKVLK